MAKDRGVGTDYDRLGVTIAANKIGMIVNWGKKLHEELQQYEDTAANALREAAQKARAAKRETDVAAAALLTTFADNEVMLASAPFSGRIALLSCIAQITSDARAQHIKYGNRFTSKELLDVLIKHVAAFDMTEEHVMAPAQEAMSGTGRQRLQKAPFSLGNNASRRCVRRWPPSSLTIAWVSPFLSFPVGPCSMRLR